MKKSHITANEQLGLRELIAMGVGGMIGGGIFSVMGLAAGITGHATPIAFALGGLLALIGGYSIAAALVGNSPRQCLFPRHVMPNNAQYSASASDAAISSIVAYHSPREWPRIG
jgi:hypothetical protein